MSEFLRPADAAAERGVTTNFIYNRIAAGDIPAVKTGRAVRIPRREWEAWKRRQAAQESQGNATR